MTYFPQASAFGSARAAFLARIREIAAEYHQGMSATACMAEIFAALREYDRKARSHQQPTRRSQP